MRCILDHVSLGVRAALLGGVLAVAAGAARADDVDERAQDVIDALRGSDVPRAAGLLESAALRESLAARPALVHVLCDRAYRCDDAFRSAPAAARRSLSAALLGLSERTHEGAPGDVRALWALAHALVLRERSGPPEGAPAWLRAADLLDRAHDQAPGDGEALGYAVTFLLEGAVLEPGDQHGLLKRATALSRKAQRAHRDATGLTLTLASAHVWAARALLPDDRRASKAALQAAFAQLESESRRDPPRGDVAALWNDAVTLDAEAHFALRRRYLAAPALALGGGLVLDVPISPRWIVTRVPASGDSAEYVYVSQTDAAGTLLRQMLFRRYTWGFSYAFTGPNEVKGDNVKNIARGLRDVSAERVFAPLCEPGPVRKARLGRELVGQSFEVVGETAGEERRPLALHGWCVRSGRQATFGVLVYAYGEDRSIDAEMQAVLDSLREPED